MISTLGNDFGDDNDALLSKSEASSTLIIDAVNKILAKALVEKVSEIHVEPQEEFMRIRMRKDGVLQEYFQLPKKVVPAITARFKFISDMDIAEQRQPQFSRIRRTFQGRIVDFLVDSLPSLYGERICLKILDKSIPPIGLDNLITDPDTLALVREAASHPSGLIIVTGPSGSGKSSTLYSILAERNEPGINIITIEDPIELALPGINQCQVIRDKHLTSYVLLRAVLGQRPDIILVGETRDRETAKTALEAALRGNLVLTAFYNNHAVGVIARLDEMGCEPFMVSGTLLGILAQRLVRRVCDRCRIAYNPTLEELARYGLSASQEVDIVFYKANTIHGNQRQEMGDKLCEKCHGSGYDGRVGVYEFLKVTERIKALIVQGANTERIKEAAVEEGMVSLLAYSLNLVRQGYTTFEELERVAFMDSGLEAELKAKRKNYLTCQGCDAGLQLEWLDCPYCMMPRFPSLSIN